MTEFKTLCFDIDDTITKWNSDRIYEDFKPHHRMVKTINELYDAGHRIVLFTARGMTSCGPDAIDSQITPRLLHNLEKIGLKYHEVIMKKPSYDIIVDDKAMHPADFLELISQGKNFSEVLKSKTQKHLENLNELEY